MRGLSIMWFPLTDNGSQQMSREEFRTIKDREQIASTEILLASRNKKGKKYQGKGKKERKKKGKGIKKEKENSGKGVP